MLIKGALENILLEKAAFYNSADEIPQLTPEWIGDDPNTVQFIPRLALAFDEICIYQKMRNNFINCILDKGET